MKTTNVWPVNCVESYHYKVVTEYSHHHTAAVDWCSSLFCEWTLPHPLSPFTAWSHSLFCEWTLPHPLSPFTAWSHSLFCEWTVPHPLSPFTAWSHSLFHEWTVHHPLSPFTTWSHSLFWEWTWWWWCRPHPCVSTHRISDPRSGPAQLLPPHVKQRSHPHGVCPQIPDR